MPEVPAVLADRETVWEQLSAELEARCSCCQEDLAAVRHLPTEDELCLACARHSDEPLLAELEPEVVETPLALL